MDLFQNLNYEQIRLVAFLFFLVAFAILERLIPKRPPQGKIKDRWPGNFLIVFSDSLLVKILFPMTALGFAQMMNERGIGIMNLFQLPVWLHLILTVALLDMAIYFQHRAFHRVGLLWRLHRMHHTDVDLDVSSALRFHPIEILLSMLIKLTVIAVIGAHAEGVIIFEILLNATAMFNHANIKIPVELDKVIRLFVVTPDFHRVHHTTHREEQDSNFGFNMPWWDYLFKTYIPQPKEGHDKVVLGTPNFREPKDNQFLALLNQPFREY